jgi:hypothetical protein
MDNMPKLTKTQRMIPVAAALLILVALLFPPYKECPFNDKGEWTGTCYVKWTFNKSLLDSIRSIKDTSWKSSGIEFGSMEINYPLMRQLLWTEILGIIVPAGAALLFTKKR